MGLFDRIFSRRRPRQAFEFRARELAGTGNYDVAAVGESRYQDALWAGASGYRSERVRVEATAMLVREPDNEHDPNAVAVYLAEGEKVAYLSQRDAADYAPPLDELARQDYVGACAAVIVGGGRHSDGREGFLGIWLDLAEADEVLLPAEDSGSRRWRRDGTATGTSRPLRSPAGEYLGKHYTEYVDDVSALKRHGALDEAATLLRGLIDAVEAEAAAEGVGVAPWYYEQLAIVLRKQQDFEGEVEILDRYAALSHAPGASEAKLLDRLPKARARLEKSKGA